MPIFLESRGGVGETFFSNTENYVHRIEENNSM